MTRKRIDFFLLFQISILNDWNTSYSRALSHSMAFFICKIYLQISLLLWKYILTSLDHLTYFASHSLILEFDPTDHMKYDSSLVTLLFCINLLCRCSVWSLYHTLFCNKSKATISGVVYHKNLHALMISAMKKFPYKCCILYYL